MYTTRKIITTDPPHSYNALKNEYPANGNGRHPVGWRIIPSC